MKGGRCPTAAGCVFSNLSSTPRTPGATLVCHGQTCSRLLIERQGHVRNACGEVVGIIFDDARRKHRDIFVAAAIQPITAALRSTDRDSGILANVSAADLVGPLVRTQRIDAPNAVHGLRVAYIEADLVDGADVTRRRAVLVHEHAGELLCSSKDIALGAAYIAGQRTEVDAGTC